MTCLHCPKQAEQTWHGRPPQGWQPLRLGWRLLGWLCPSCVEVP